MNRVGSTCPKWEFGPRQECQLLTYWRATVDPTRVRPFSLYAARGGRHGSSTVPPPALALFNYGIGIHLLQSEDLENMPKKREINPKDNHISFQRADPSFVLDLRDNTVRELGGGGEAAEGDGHTLRPERSRRGRDLRGPALLP
ncbi:hypothetical protein BHE74_00052720 [Ensete ventricosum]|nr:hypothetical protein BHE74_00052720 [Ensete ventricosum]